MSRKVGKLVVSLIGRSGSLGGEAIAGYRSWPEGVEGWVFRMIAVIADLAGIMVRLSRRPCFR